LKYTDTATDLIGWLRSKTFILALLRTAQMEATGVTSAVIRAVLTRWTAHYMAYKRLLELQPILTSEIYHDEARAANAKKIVTGDAASKAKAVRMIAVIKDPLFWHSMTRFVTFSVSVPVLMTSAGQHETSPGTAGDCSQYHSGFILPHR
jgi:hypothetical protein